MSEIKKKNDLLFLIITVIIAVVAIIFKLYYVPISFLIGWIIASLVIAKDVRKLKKNEFDKGIIKNFAFNFIAYAIGFIIAGYFFDVLGLLVAAAGLMVYRTLFYNKVKAKGDDDDWIY